MKRIDPLKGFEVFTNLLRRFRREKTTRGIIPSIIKYQNETNRTDSPIYNYEQFIKDTEKIFQYVPSDFPKMLMCVHCGDTVTIPDNCACGKIQDVYKAIERLMNEAKWFSEANRVSGWGCCGTASGCDKGNDKTSIANL